MTGNNLTDLEIHFTPRGPFMTRDGKARHLGLSAVNKKLCLCATDKQYLVLQLFELSNREDCIFVKYTSVERDGMFLGRVFMTEEEMVGELWVKYKQDPKLLCSIQDDDFTAPFREKYK